MPNSLAGLVGGHPQGDDVDSSTHGDRRRVLEDINSVDSNSSSSGLPSHVRIPGKGTSQADPDTRPPNVREVSSLPFSYDNEVSILDNPEPVALILRKIRARRWELPSLEQMRERDTYIQMAVANAKVSYLVTTFGILLG